MSVSPQTVRQATGGYPDGEQLSRARPSAAAQTLAQDLARVARRPYNILLSGETGTGKTRAAREIHQLSARAQQPFVELNCANLPENLVESELFGYCRGAFTGAERDRAGLFEEAQGGILFLDEIGELAPAVQNKLLKAIEEKRIKRLGTNRFTDCDVQIIAATSRELPEMVAVGLFREDLYCRLAVLTVRVPALRERREDIPGLLEYFLREAAATVEATEKRPVSFRMTAEAQELLCAYEYPGNIRALRNLVYELTSYVENNELISFANVVALFARQSARQQLPPISGKGLAGANSHDEYNLKLAERWQELPELTENDLLLPLELCVLRRGETLVQWEIRAKLHCIESVCEASGGSQRRAAQRLGLTTPGIKSYRYRHKPRPKGATP